MKDIGLQRQAIMCLLHVSFEISILGFSLITEISLLFRTLSFLNADGFCLFCAIFMQVQLALDLEAPDLNLWLPLSFPTGWGELGPHGKTIDTPTFDVNQSRFQSSVRWEVDDRTCLNCCFTFISNFVCSAVYYYKRFCGFLDSCQPVKHWLELDLSMFKSITLGSPKAASRFQDAP